MLLISVLQISPYLIGSILILIIIILSAKGILSPYFTIILILLLGFFSFSLLPKYLPSDNTIALVEPGKKDSISTGISITPLTSLPPSDSNSNQPKNTPPINPDEIPAKYDIEDRNLWTYQTSGYWQWEESFTKYLKNKTGWTKTKRGNYEIKVDHLGTFSQEIRKDERVYIYSGGEIRITVNGQTCCCENMLSLSQDISDSQLVKANEKLQKAISDLLLKNKKQVVEKIQSCF